MAQHSQKQLTATDQAQKSNQKQSTKQPIAPNQFSQHELTSDHILTLQRTLGNQATQTMLMRRGLLPAQKPQAKKWIQRVDLDAPDWGSAGAISRSGEGAEGVIFVTFPDGRLIVKFIDDAAPAKFAEQVISGVGIERASSRYLPNNDSDAEAASIRALIGGRMDEIAEAKREQVGEQLENRKYIQVQEMVAGVSGARLDADQKATVLSNPAVLQDLGRLAVTDAFLGNYDRLSKSSINTGNFMIGTTVAGPSLIAIDNDTDASKGSNKGARGADLTYIMDQKNIRELAQMLLSKLTGGFTALPSGVGPADVPTLIDQMAEQMKIGIKDASEKIMDMVRTDPRFFDDMKSLEKDTMPGARGTKASQRMMVRKTMKERLKVMQEAYVANGWDKIELADEAEAEPT